MDDILQLQMLVNGPEDDPICVSRLSCPSYASCQSAVSQWQPTTMT